MNAIAGHLASNRALRVLPLVALFSLWSSWAHANDYNFTTNNGAVTLTGYSGPGGQVGIPAEIGGLPVRFIADNAFSGSTSLTGVTIPDSVTRIGAYAFRGCARLTRVTIGRGVGDIDTRAFSYCESLPAITIPGGVVGIGDEVFWGCVGLTNVTIGAGVTNVGLRISGCPRLSAITVDPLNAVYRSFDGVLFNKTQTTLLQCPEGRTGSYRVPDGVTGVEGNAFADCTGLTQITIPDSVTDIKWDAFQGCAGLVSVSLGRGITSIGDRAFRKCSHLNDVTIGDNVVNLGVNAFADCTSLTNITIPNGVTNIEVLAFSWCTSLATITVPDSVTRIGADAFRGCTSLTNVTIGSAVTRLETRFSGCHRLRTISVHGLNPVYSSVDGVLCDKTRTRVLRCPEGQSGSYAVPTGVTCIAENAFADCGLLTRIQMPGSMTNIGTRAFGYCTRLNTIAIPDNVTSVGDEAFRGCTSLTNVAIGRGVCNLEARFTACHKLLTITVDALNPAYASADGVLFNKDRTTLIQCPESRAGSYTVPDGVTALAWNAFADCIRLTNIMLSATLTNIGPRAFCYCERLLTVAIPDRVAIIGDDAFRSCTSLTNIALGQGVVGIGNRFGGCRRLMAIRVDPLNAVYTSVDGVLLNKDQSLLIQCPEGKAGGFTLPGNVTSIDAYAFADCAALTNITLSDRLTNIGARAFSWCAKLTTITLPQTVTAIGSRAFESCPSLARVCSRGNAPTVGSDAFYDDNNVTVYYLRTTKGWGPTFGGRPTSPWVAPNRTGT